MPRILLTLFLTTIFIAAAGATAAQSTRPRRVKPPDTLLGPEPTPAPATRAESFGLFALAIVLFATAWPMMKIGLAGAPPI